MPDQDGPALSAILAAARRAVAQPLVVVLCLNLALP